MPRQRIHHSRSTYDFPTDFPERLGRFKEESGLSWAEIARRLGNLPLHGKKVVKEGGEAQRSASDGAAGPGRRHGPPPHIHRLNRKPRPRTRGRRG